MNCELKILHFYHDLMNLYGDWANADILARALAACGTRAAVEKKSVGEEIDFAAYDFVYIGSGTEQSQRACMRDLACHKDALLEKIEAGLFVLATGNSHELFGRAVTTADGERFDGLGLIDFETVRNKTRVTGDCIYAASFLPEKLIGFVNRSGGGQTGDNEALQSGSGPAKRPFTTEMGPGASDDSRYEGIRYKNLLGTYLTGPVLVRNPPLLAYFAKSLLKARQGADVDAHLAHGQAESLLFERQVAAYRAALGELERRG